MTGAAHFILPSPSHVAAAWLRYDILILTHSITTATEIILGLLSGAVLGIVSALSLAYFRPARLWLMPVLVASQAIPVFALAPILVLWLGYGMVSKIAMAMLIIYFPVTTAFYDGLRRADPGLLELAQTMSAGRWATLCHVRVPGALPALASGLRVATAVAPIGAVVGEWVGSSAGLGHFMLLSNARMQVDVMFAALVTLAVLSVTLYSIVDTLLRRMIPWSPDTHPADD
jgi:putative hydroxymethylpyrimidine transport system permease protein